MRGTVICPLQGRKPIGGETNAVSTVSTDYLEQLKIKKKLLQSLLYNDAHHISRQSAKAEASFISCFFL